MKLKGVDFSLTQLKFHNRGVFLKIKIIREVMSIKKVSNLILECERVEKKAVNKIYNKKSIKKRFKKVINLTEPVFILTKIFKDTK